MKPSERVQAEQRIVLWRAPFEKDEPDVSLGTVYEDEHLLVVDKPPLMTVHPTARYHHSTVIKKLESVRPGRFLSLIHRLDRETSGLLLLGLSARADRAFKRVIEDRSLGFMAQKVKRPSGSAAIFDKTYLTITHGTPSSRLIDAPLERDSDNPLRVKMRIAAPGRGLTARTGIEVIETRAGYALVRCRLYTGRQHQIRLHLAHVGCPIVGDKLYGPDERLLARAADGELTDEDLAHLELPRHALHAHHYRLTHAIAGGVIELTSPLPPDLQAFWDSR